MVVPAVVVAPAAAAWVVYHRPGVPSAPAAAALVVVVPVALHRPVVVVDHPFLLPIGSAMAEIPVRRLARHQHVDEEGHIPVEACTPVEDHPAVGRPDPAVVEEGIHQVEIDHPEEEVHHAGAQGIPEDIVPEVHPVRHLALPEAVHQIEKGDIHLPAAVRCPFRRWIP